MGGFDGVGNREFAALRRPRSGGGVSRSREFYGGFEKKQNPAIQPLRRYRFGFSDSAEDSFGFRSRSFRNGRAFRNGRPFNPNHALPVSDPKNRFFVEKRFRTYENSDGFRVRDSEYGTSDGEGFIRNDFEPPVFRKSLQTDRDGIPAAYFR